MSLWSTFNKEFEKQKCPCDHQRANRNEWEQKYLRHKLADGGKAVPEVLVVEQGHEDTQVHVHNTDDDAHLHLHAARRPTRNGEGNVLHVHF